MAVPGDFRKVPLKLKEKGEFTRASYSIELLSLLPFTLVQWLDGRWVDVLHGRLRASIEARCEAMLWASPDARLRILEHDGSHRGFVDALEALPPPEAV